MPAGKVVAVLNMKGGVGKTTLSAHVFRVFYQARSKRVLLVDLDPQFNLTQCVMSQKDYDTIKATGQTVMRTFEAPPSTNFFAVNTAVTEPPEPSDVAKRLRYALPGRDPYIDLIAGDFDLVKYSLIDDHAQLVAALEFFKRFIAKAKKIYDVIVIDCNPSSSFLTRAALSLATHVISPVRPDKYSVLGVELVDRLLSHLGLTPEQLIVMNAVGRKKTMGSVESELRSHATYGPRVLVTRLHTSKLLQADQMYTGFATDRPVAWRDTLRSEILALTWELAPRLGV